MVRKLLVSWSPGWFYPLVLQTRVHRRRREAEGHFSPTFVTVQYLDAKMFSKNKKKHRE
jgi:hypothetical protein